MRHGALHSHLARNETCYHYNLARQLWMVRHTILRLKNTVDNSLKGSRGTAGDKGAVEGICMDNTWRQRMMCSLIKCDAFEISVL